MVVTAVGAVGRGGGTAVGDGSGVASVVAGGALASVGRVSMMKRAVGAGGVFLRAWGRGMSEEVAVGTLRVAVSVRRFPDLKAF